MRQTAGTAVLAEHVLDSMREWNFPVLLFGWISVDLDRDDHEVRFGKGRATIRRRLDREPSIELGARPAGEAAHRLELGVVDVYQPKRRPSKRRSLLKHPADGVEPKAGAPGSDDDDRWSRQVRPSPSGVRLRGAPRTHGPGFHCRSRRGRLTGQDGGADRGSGP